MRLLESRTLTFHDFTEEKSRPRYAILSHRWGDDEVTYNDMRKRKDQARGKKGFAKILACAEQAQEDGLDYFWIDTCCIDKSSSAELSEAINSMFRWYRNAAVCYVHLCDTPPHPGHSSPLDYPAWEAKFKQSTWFSRGWTLQEMIAPRNLVFYASDWTTAGAREELASAIEARTRVPRDVLTTGDFSKTSLAHRMSWAADRQTTRTEDMAYSLLGIFDISMPLLYGEGERAFIRLQKEIIKDSDDMSIFSWLDGDASFSTYSGLLAKSPSHFAKCQDIRWIPAGAHPPLFEATNKGIRIALDLIPNPQRPGESTAVLRGVRRTTMPLTTVGLYLHRVGDGQYARVDSRHLAVVRRVVFPKGTDGNAPLEPFFVRENPVMETGDHSRAGSISLRVESNYLGLEKVQPAQSWDSDTAVFSLDRPPTPPTRDPFVPAVFTLDSKLGPGDTIQITVDLGRPWRECIQADASWHTQVEAARPSSLEYRVQCRKSGHPMVQMVIRRGLVDQQSTVSLMIRATQRRDLPVHVRDVGAVRSEPLARSGLFSNQHASGFQKPFGTFSTG